MLKFYWFKKISNYCVLWANLRSSYFFLRATEPKLINQRSQIALNLVLLFWVYKALLLRSFYNIKAVLLICFETESWIKLEPYNFYFYYSKFQIMYYYLEAKYKEKRIFILQKYIQYYRTRKKGYKYHIQKKIRTCHRMYVFVLCSVIISFHYPVWNL